MVPGWVAGAGAGEKTGLWQVSQSKVGISNCVSYGIDDMMVSYLVECTEKASLYRTETNPC